MSKSAERIRERREFLDLTQEDLAYHIGKDHKQIWRYESGTSTPRVDILIDLARELNTTADWLLGLTDDPNRPISGDNGLTDAEKAIIQQLRGKSPELGQKILDLLEVL